MVNFQITGAGNVVEFLDTIGVRTAAKVNAAVGVWCLRMSKLAQGKVSGGLLKIKTGALRDAISRGTSTTIRSGGVVGIVGLAGASKEVAIAGAAQEFGANIPAHVVQALAGSRLRFMVGGKLVFAKQVHLPAVKIPERSFLRSSLEDIRAPALSEIAKAAQSFGGLI